MVRHLEIENFRAIKKLVWFPSPGLNCLIGSGDSGKSTILDAIDLVLGARRSYSFNDADFFQSDVNAPITISVTLGELDDELLNVEKYGFFLRAFNKVDNQIYDEPQTDMETVLTIKMLVDSDLEPDWRLYSARAETAGIERRLPWKHRELISPSKLGATSYGNLAWGSRSVLNRLSEETFDVSTVLAQLGRQTRQAFATQQIEGVTRVIEQVETIGNNLGVPLGGIKALLDVNGLSLSNGAISLHNSNDTPLRQLGTGSSRLLISGIQKAASRSTILIVDEAEYGLEPYRITKLLHELGSKDSEPTKQVFITTHSPHVLRELQANQLYVLRPLVPAPPHLPANLLSHIIYHLEGGDDQQSTLRVCAEAFLSKKVIVCEGKTEIGLIRGVDLYVNDVSPPNINSKGVYCADGGGDSMYIRAKVFSSLGYPTAILKDSDKSVVHQPFTAEATALGISVFEWGDNNATEDAIFKSCPPELVPQLLNVAIERKGEDAVRASIISCSAGVHTLDDCISNFNDSHRITLATAANKKGWYKDIEPAEHVFYRIVSPRYADFNGVLTTTINSIFSWASQ
jgi:predicted ATPase